MSTAAPAEPRLAIWLDDLRASRWDHDLVEWAARASGLTLVAVLVSTTPSLDGFRGFVARAAFRALRIVEGFLLRRRAMGHADPLHRFDLSGLLARERISVVAGDDAAALRDLDLDLIVFLGAEMPRTGVPVAARRGTIAFESADPRRRLDRPTAFWEVVERRDATGFAIRHFAGAADADGTDLRRGWIQTRHFHAFNEAALRAKAYDHLRTSIRGALAADRPAATLPAVAAAGSARPPPSTLQTLSYFGRLVSAAVGKKIAKARGIEEVWQVAFLRSDWRDAAMSDGIAIPNPPGRYLADPFVLRHRDGDYCFVEELDRSTGRGAIGVYRLGATAAERLGVVIDEPFHLSFPYLFEHEGALFMCPESSAHRDIRIYRCVEFPMGWVLETIVMSGIRAVDTMIFAKDGKWWLLSNMDPAERGDLVSELFVFSADSPFAASWQPHPANPVIVDSRSARNAGLLVEDCKLYRVSQRQGFERYGKSVQINEIIELSENAYGERCVATIEPVFREGLLGTHHFHSRAGVTVFDFLAVAPRGKMAARSP